MAIDRIDRTVVTTGTNAGPAPAAAPVPVARDVVQTNSQRITRAGPGGSEMGRRIVVLVFGLIQIVIGARFVLLLLDAREANGLVSGILNLSQLFVAPLKESSERTPCMRPAQPSTSRPSWPSLAGRSSS